MVLEGLPTRVVVMIVIVVLMALRPLLAINQGKDNTSDGLANRKTQTPNIFPVSFLFLFYLVCISTLYFLFEILGCI